MTFDTTLRPDPFIGRTFGPYRLTERIREVRVGAAFIAEHRHLDRHVVVKLFQPAPPGTAGGGLPSVEARLRVLSRAWHEHVLPLVDVGEGDDGLVFVALGLQDDVPLTSLSAQGNVALPWARARAIGQQVAGAIRWAESQGIPLGELGPAQVFLAPPRGAPLHGGRAAARGRIDLVTPEALGLVAPPARVDRSLDVGRILYWLVTGHPPDASADSPPTDPVLKRPDLDIPGEADALIMRALDPDPGKRWPDLASLHRALGGRDDEIGGPAASARRPTGARPSASAGTAWFASDGATAAAAADGAPVDLLDAPMPGATDALESGELGGVHDDGRSDRFNSLDFDPDYDDREGRHGSFGTRGLFARPSRGALISVAVAGAAALAIAVMVIRVRLHSPSEGEGEEDAEEEVAADAALSPAMAGPPASDAPPSVAPSAAGEGAGGAGQAGEPRPGEAEVAGAGAPDGAPAGAAAPPLAAAAPGPSGVAVAPPEPPAAARGAGAALPGPRAGLTPAAPGVPTPGPSPGQPGLPSAPAGPTAVQPGASAGGVPSGPPAAAPGAGSTPAGAPVATAPAVPSTTVDPNDRPSPEAPGTPPGGAGPAAAPAAVAPGPTPPADADGRCSLSLGSKPWADVWIDGRRAGLTPLTDFPIACGAHEVVFTSTDLGLERRISVNAKPGDRTRRILDLEAPQPAAGGPAVAPPASPAASRPDCRLSLGSRPWSEVWIDGRRAGVTPLVSVAVRCGRHDVLFVSREANVERRETIFVAEGQNVKRIVTLVEGE